MKIKKNTLSTRISDLYGMDNYHSHIKLGREYWHFFSEDTPIYKATHKHWNKLKISYIRSGCIFYVFPDSPDVNEEFCPAKCFMTSRFILADIDPMKDLGEDLGINENSKLRLRFDDERTVVKNWPNEKEIEVDEDFLYKKFVEEGNVETTTEYLMIKTLQI